MPRRSLQHTLLGGLVGVCCGSSWRVGERLLGCSAWETLGTEGQTHEVMDGLMIHSGDPVNSYADTTWRHILLRQGVLGIKVKIMLP